jgi:diguanylate cyclase (GGDEF)-like protein
MNAGMESAWPLKYRVGAVRSAVTGLWGFVREKQKLEEANRSLRREVARLEQLAYLDPLTRLGNRRRFDDAVPSELSRAARNGEALTLLILDVDRFKECNDKYGHEAGDSLLVQISGVLKRFCRRGGDLAIRYAGDEFALVLPGVARVSAQRIAERAREEIHALSQWHARVPSNDRASVSIGGATSQPRDSWPSAKLIEAADGALYRAKRAGRNRVEFAA